MDIKARVAAIKSVMSHGDTTAPLVVKLTNAGYVGFTRNMIAGLLHRHNLIGEKPAERRGEYHQAARVQKALPKPRAPIERRAPLQVSAGPVPKSGSKPGKLREPLPPPPTAKPKQFITAIRGHECGWPLWGNEPITDVESLMVCGGTVEPGTGPYCEYHRRIAGAAFYAKPTEKGVRA